MYKLVNYKTNVRLNANSVTLIFGLYKNLKSRSSYSTYYLGIHIHAEIILQTGRKTQRTSILKRGMFYGKNPADIFVDIDTVLQYFECFERKL